MTRSKKLYLLASVVVLLAGLATSLTGYDRFIGRANPNAPPVYVLLGPLGPLLLLVTEPRLALTLLVLYVSGGFSLCSRIHPGSAGPWPWLSVLTHLVAWLGIGALVAGLVRGGV